MNPTQKNFVDPLPPTVFEVVETPEPVMFPPSGIYYDGPSGRYLVDSGQYFRTYGRKSPVLTGVSRFYRSEGMDDKEAGDEARAAIAAAEIDRHVEWSGNLAGCRKGLIHSSDGKPMLVLTSPSLSLIHISEPTRPY